MPSLTGQLFDTAGIEVEGTLINTDSLKTNLLPKLSKLLQADYSKLILDTDASVGSFAEGLDIGNRRFVFSINSKAYNKLRLAGSMGAQVYGYEFKTVPLQVSDSELDKVLYPLFSALYEFGDVISDRSSIHTHIGYANNFRMLTNLLIIMLALEPALYRLGGMGGVFRGHINNAAYCRPMLNSCAVPVTKSSGNLSRIYAQIVNPMEAKKATNLSDFWASMGIDSSLPSQHKYHPSRYAGMNFFSLYSHGTIEWRYFNKSFDVALVKTIIKYMRGVAEMSSLVTKRDLLRLDIIDSSREISFSDAQDVMIKILALCREKEVELLPNDREMAHLLDVLKESNFSALPPTPTLTHISSFQISKELVDSGKLKLVRDVIPTNFVDIHNIQYMSIYS